MIVDLVLSFVDYLIIFIITAIAVFVGVVGAIIFSINLIAERISPSRREYMNEYEKSYRRKTI